MPVSYTHLHVLIRKGFHSGELMVCLVINGKDIPLKEQLVEELCRIKGMTSISYSINREKTNVIMGKDVYKRQGRNKKCGKEKCSCFFKTDHVHRPFFCKTVVGQFWHS